MDPVTETIDHLDGNPLNNNFNNLQIIPLADHAKLDNKRAKPKVLKCIWCKNDFISNVLNSHHRNKNKKDGCAGPFCSNKCTGQYTWYLRKGGKPLGYENMPETEYYKNKKTKPAL